VIGSYKVEFGGTFFILRPFFDLKIPLMYVALINVKIEGLNLIKFDWNYTCFRLSYTSRVSCFFK
jgi:hypothetical protein